jgi:type VI secretion system protein ImpG
MLWLHQHRKGLRLRSDGHEVELPVTGLTPVGLTPELPLLPWPALAPDGLRLLQEYFTLTQKLLFVEIGGLERVPSDSVGESFEIELEFERPPPLPERLDESAFRLHCVPVVNLFEASADPVTRNPRVHEHLIRAGGVNPQHMEVYSVDSVEGARPQRRGTRRYDPFFQFSHLDAEESDRAFYALRRARSPIDGAIDTYLAVMTPADVSPELVDEVLSIDLTCTNRLLAADLRPGDICKPTPRSPTIATFSNITEVTRPARPPIGDEMHWRVVSHLGLNVRTLTEPDVLRALLAHYNLHGESDHQRSRANELRIRAIRSVASTAEQRMLGRAPVRGIHTHVEVDETGYPTVADAFLLGCALHWLFATEVPLNCFHRLTMAVQPLGVEFRWPATTGTQPVF